MRRRGAALAGLAVLVAVPSPASAAARPASVPQVVTARQATALGTRALRVSTIARRPVVVRLVARAYPPTGGTARVVAAVRQVYLRRPGRASAVALSLTAAGRRALDTCAPPRLVVTASTRSLAGRNAAPRVTRTRRTLRGDGRPCYRVGTAALAINPGTDGRYGGQPVYLGGYGFGANPVTGSRPATGILGEGASVRAFVVSDGTHHLAIADIEAQGWFAATRDGALGLVDIRRAAERATGGRLKAGEIIVQSDHSHSGIDAMGVWGGMPLAYRRYVVARATEAISRAFDRLRPGTLSYGTANGRDLLSNQFDYDAANHEVDSEVRVLQARDGGRVFATLLNFSAHATVLGSDNRKVSGDWVQAANPLLEKAFGGSAVTVVGTLGRTQPTDRDCTDKTAKGDAASLCRIGEYAARVVARARQAAVSATLLPGPPRIATRSYLVQDVASSPLLLGILYAGGPVGFPLNRSLSPPWMTGNVVGTVTASARIGDVLLSAVPGEAYPQIARTVRDLAPGMRGYMTAGLANDQLGYLIAPYAAYPEPIRRTFFNQRGDEVSPVDNDNYAFNVSTTMGERVTCSLLRGAGELSGEGSALRVKHSACLPFVNDAALAPGADVG